MRRLRYGILAALAIAALPAAAAEKAHRDPPTVGVVEARLEKLAPKIAMPGTAMSLSDSHVASEVEGKISWVAEVGTVVPQGGVVARIDQSVAKLQLESDRANCARLAAQLRFDRAQAARIASLYSQSAISRTAKEQAESTRDVDAGALAEARAAMMRSQYKYDHSVIRAPFPGRVVQRLINPGEYATIGKDLVRLVDISSLEVSVQIPIDSARYLKEGSPVTMIAEGKPVVGRLRAVVPVGDVVSRSIELRIAVPAHAMMVGDAVKALIPSAAPHDAIAVPRDALVLREDNTYVFKVDAKGAAQRIAVETGSEDGGLIEVKGRIAPGERVIVRGAEHLEAGETVRAVRVP